MLGKHAGLTAMGSNLWDKFATSWDDIKLTPCTGITRSYEQFPPTVMYTKGASRVVFRFYS